MGQEKVKRSYYQCCMLRCSGKSFNVDAFLAISKWKPNPIWHKGKYRHIKTKRIKSVDNGFNMPISKAGDLPKQINSATKFIQSHYNELKRLSEYPGVEMIQIDFALQLFDPVYFARFPDKFLKCIEGLNISLDLSIYCE